MAMRDRGFEVSSVGSGNPAPFTRAGLEYHFFPLARFIDPISDWRSYKALARLIKELRPSVVQCFDTKLNLFVPLASRSVGDVKVVSTVNGLGWLYSSQSALALSLRPVFRALQRRADRSTSVTVFQNRDDQAFYQQCHLVNTSHDLIIPGSGIDVGRLKRAIADGPTPTDLRRSLGLGDAKVVMTVTRLTRQKGIPTLLKAAKLVHEQRHDVLFLLVGSREKEGALAISQAELDRHSSYVRAIGSRSDIPSLLNIADVFVYPTDPQRRLSVVLSSSTRRHG